MTVVTFDTHKFVKTLQSKGLTADQAESIVEVVREARNADLAQLTTKSDLSEVKFEILKWMMTGFIAIIGLLIAIMAKIAI